MRGGLTLAAPRHAARLGLRRPPWPMPSAPISMVPSSIVPPGGFSLTIRCESGDRVGACLGSGTVGRPGRSTPGGMIRMRSVPFVRSLGRRLALSGCTVFAILCGPLLGVAAALPPPEPGPAETQAAAPAPAPQWPSPECRRYRAELASVQTSGSATRALQDEISRPAVQWHLHSRPTVVTDSALSFLRPAFASSAT